MQIKNGKKSKLRQQISAEKSGKNPFLKAALRYSRLGWSVIPLVEKDKKPMIKSWLAYQKNQATEEQIRKWWENDPNANVGIVTGIVSGLVVLDADSQKARDFIKAKGSKQTPVSDTAKGRHIYFKHPRKRIPNKVNKELDIDIRGDGGYVVAPPSIHPSGREYKWVLPPWEQGLAELPAWVNDSLVKNPKTKACCKKNNPNWVSTALSGVRKGERNQMAARLAGHYIYLGMPDSEIATHLLIWNEHNTPPLPSQEIHRTIASIRATHERNHTEPTDFPDVMSGLAGDFAKLYAQYLEAPVHFFYMSFLTCIGSILSKRISLYSEIAPQPRLFTILLGESADDRKSTVINKVTDFFMAANSEDDIEMILSGVGFNICRGVGSAEGLQKRLQNSPNLLLCLDEFKQFVGKCRIDNSVLLPCVSTLFENNRYENQTKKSRIILEDAHLSLLAASTTDTWDQVWTSAFSAIGFNNRLFLVPGKGHRKFPFPSKIPNLDKEELISRLRNLVLKFDKQKEFKISQKGRELYERWYLNLQPTVHSKRLDTYALRLMPLLAVDDDKDEVDEETVKKAIALCKWQLNVRRLYDPIDAENKMAEMEEKIRRVLRSGPKTYTRVGIWFFEKAKENLKRNKEIRCFGSKRKRVKWELDQ
jgi:hypothetical protein